MNPFLDQMLSQVYELEGLLLVIERHKGDTSEFIYEMVRRKVERINELAPMCVPEVLGHKDTSEDVEGVEVVPEQKDLEVEPEVEEPKFDDETEVDEEPITDEEPECYEPIEEEMSDAFEESEEDETESFGVVEEFETEDSYEEADETEYNEEDSLDDDSVVDYDDLSKDEFDEVLTVDEALQRSLSKNLWKAFSLNDHFRYRRELFSNSDLEMRNTINMVEAMQSFAEAEEYFYTDLEWDAESPEVKDFMEIIRKHFL